MSNNKMKKWLKKTAEFNDLSYWFVDRCWNSYEHIVFMFNTYKNIQNSNSIAPLYPRKLYWVEPESVCDLLTNSSFDMLRDTGRIVDGDWDIKGNPLITDTYIYKGFASHFIDGVPWEETNWYQQKLEQVQNKESRRYASVDNLNNKTDLYDSLYEKFSSGNYLTQNEIMYESSQSGVGNGGCAFLPNATKSSIMRHEIAVHIGRDGTLFVQDGKHRLVIARLAELGSIPIRIVVRHEFWQNLREQIVVSLRQKQIENDEFLLQQLASDVPVSSDLFNHPDLESLY